MAHCCISGSKTTAVHWFLWKKERHNVYSCRDVWSTAFIHILGLAQDCGFASPLSFLYTEVCKHMSTESKVVIRECKL